MMAHNERHQKGTRDYQANLGNALRATCPDGGSRNSGQPTGATQDGGCRSRTVQGHENNWCQTNRYVLAAELAKIFLAGYRAGREHKGEGNIEATLDAQEQAVAAALKRLGEEGECRE